MFPPHPSPLLSSPRYNLTFSLSLFSSFSTPFIFFGLPYEQSKGGKVSRSQRKCYHPRLQGRGMTYKVKQFTIFSLPIRHHDAGIPYIVVFQSMFLNIYKCRASSIFQRRRERLWIISIILDSLISKSHKWHIGEIEKHLTFFGKMYKLLSLRS